MEFILGNTFAFTVFSGYGMFCCGICHGKPANLSLGAWYLTYGATLQPFYGAAAAYAPVPGAYANIGAATASGQLTPGYTASFGNEPWRMSAEVR